MESGKAHTGLVARKDPFSEASTEVGFVLSVCVVEASEDLLRWPEGMTTDAGFVLAVFVVEAFDGLLRWLDALNTGWVANLEPPLDLPLL